MFVTLCDIESQRAHTVLWNSRGRPFYDWAWDTLRSKYLAGSVDAIILPRVLDRLTFRYLRTLVFYASAGFSLLIGLNSLHEHARKAVAVFFGLVLRPACGNDEAAAKPYGQSSENRREISWIWLGKILILALSTLTSYISIWSGM